MMSGKSENFFPFQWTNWDIPHGFFPGTLRNRNLSVGYKSIETYLKNRQDIVISLGMNPVKTVFSYQVHGANVHVVQEEMVSVVPMCDGLVTDVPGVTLGISTADCSPLLFWDTQGVVGICHAGWKGILFGVLERTLEEVKRLSKTPQSVQACIGPTIRSAHYEVKNDFYETFIKEDAKSSEFFKEKDALYFDLPGYITFRLTERGCKVWDTLEDTWESKFFSRRQQTQQGLNNTYSFASLIGIMNQNKKKK